MISLNVVHRCVNLNEKVLKLSLKYAHGSYKNDISWRTLIHYVYFTGLAY